MCCLSEMPAGRVIKKRQGVIWGKTASSFAGGSVDELVLRLADIVELHSTVALKDATIRCAIIYHTGLEVGCAVTMVDTCLNTLGGGVN